MKDPRLNTLVLILIILILVLLSSLTLINKFETEENIEVVDAVTGEMQSFEVYHKSFDFSYPTKKNTKRYDEKLLEYLENIRKSRENTFHKGKVFLKEK